MNPAYTATVQRLLAQPVPAERKALLQPLIAYIQARLTQPINLHFICTHNSRRSHLAQVWAQCAAHHYGIPGVFCYSGGTETTALYPKVAEVLAAQGLWVNLLAETENPLYSIKYAETVHPVIGFSKRLDHPFNPSSSYAAVMTCSEADQGCPFLPSADVRISLPYEDPKVSDGTPAQTAIYTARSEQIGSEMFYAFSQVGYR